MIYDLRRKGLKVDGPVYLPIEFYGPVLTQNRFRIDSVVEGKVVVENKAVAEIKPVYKAQTLTFMRLGKMRLGNLINFNVTLIKNGRKRFVI